MLWVFDYTIKEDSRRSRRNFGGLSDMAPSFTENYMIQLTASGLNGASGVCVHDPVVEEHRRAHGPAPIPRLIQRASRVTGKLARLRRVIWRPAQVRF